MNIIQKSLAQAVDDLIKEGRVAEPNKLTLPILAVQDIFSHEIHKLNSKAQTAFNTTIYSVLHQRNEPISISNPDLYHKEVFINLLSKFKICESIDGQIYVRVVDRVNFIGRVCNQFTYNKAVDEVMGMINGLADNDAITGVLAPLICMEMSNIDPNIKKYAIMSYIAINYKKQTWYESYAKDFDFKEGEMPKEV